MINRPPAQARLTYTCARCGKEVERIIERGAGYSALYCPECAEIVKREKTRERVRKFRQKH